MVSFMKTDCHNAGSHIKDCWTWPVVCWKKQKMTAFPEAFQRCSVYDESKVSLLFQYLLWTKDKHETNRIGSFYTVASEHTKAWSYVHLRPPTQDKMGK